MIVGYDRLLCPILGFPPFFRFLSFPLLFLGWVQGFMVETAACAAFDPCDIVAALNRLREA